MHRLPLLPLALAAVVALPACRDNGLTRFNSDPTAQITSHGPDAEGNKPQLLEGALTRFEGKVADPNDAPEFLTAAWYLGDEAICAAAPPAEDGSTACEARVELGIDQVRLAVSDDENATAAAFVPLEVLPTDPPVATIVLPEDGTQVYAEQRITFQGIATDTEDAPEELTITWESDVDGPLDLDTRPDASGSFADTTPLSEGPHLITLRVEDTHGKSATAVAGVTVGPPNRAPDCSVLRPTDGSIFVLGAPVAFEGLATDAELPDEQLDVSWRSDLDGLLATTSGTSTGEVLFETDLLGRGLHTITLTVADEVDAECTDSVQIKVGSPPLVTVSAPAPGFEVDAGDAVAFAASTSDGDDPPELLAVAWTSDRDGLLDATAPSPTGALAFDAAGLSVGTHVVTVTVTDLDGMTAEDSVEVEINGAPGAPVVSISPDPPGSQQDLAAVIDTDSVDPDGDPITYTYAWYRGGTLQGSYTTAAVPAAATARGDIWRVEVTPFDGRVTGPAGTAQVTVGNGAPSVDAAAIAPLVVYTDGELEVTASASDPDGDRTTLSYAWLVGGAPTGETGTTLDGDAFFDRGDVVTCVVTATDGTDTATLTSNAVTVANTPPEAPVVDLLPDEPRSGSDDLVCTIDTEAFDLDGDTPAYSFAWTVDGVSHTGTTTTTTYTGDTVPASEVGPSERWTCTATPTDGTDTGPPDSDSAVTVQGFSGWSSTTVGLADADGFSDGEQFDDLAGYAVGGAGDIDGDGLADLLVGAQGANASGSYGGKVYVVLGGVLSGGATLDLADADSELVGAADGDYAGTRLAGGGDYDSDGFPDLLVGAPLADRSATDTDAGAVYLFESEELSSGGSDDLGDSSVILEGDAAGDNLGWGATFVGDVDGDGRDDVAVGATGTTNGTAYLWLSGSLSDGIHDVGDGDVTIDGYGASALFGNAISGGHDLDGDGTADVLFGEPNASQFDTYAGAVRVFSGSDLATSAGTLLSTDAAVSITGDHAYDALGRSVALLEDVDGDGLADLLSGANGDDSGGSDAGKVGLFFGASLSSGSTYDLGDADRRFVGEAAGDYAGWAVASAQDVDRDGQTDFLIGAPRNDDSATNAGKVYLLLSDDLPSSTNVDLSTANYGFTGEGTADAAGWSVAGPGDVNADGLDDLLVGAPYEDSGGTSAGRAYLILAP